MRSLANPGREAEIRSRLRALRPDTAPRWGRMSSHQMICHVADAFRMALGEREVTPATGWRQRTLLKWLALWAPLRWPPGIQTRPEIDPQRAGSRPDTFPADLAALEALLARMIAEASRLEGRPHPTFGALSKAAWLRWGYLHSDHHLRQFGA